MVVRPTSGGTGRRKFAVLTGIAASMLTLSAIQIPATAAPAAPTQNSPAQSSTSTQIAQKPYMGWSSWSLESTNYPGVNPTGGGSWLNEAHVLQQADILAAKFKQHGYEYVNIDAGWVGSFDQYGRPVVDAKKFPDGMAYVADYVHKKGLKLGSYLAVGLDLKAYNDGNSPIFGTTDCHTRDLVYPDLRQTSGWDNQSYQINFASPCAQAYIQSEADVLAGWGVDFLKLDGVGPGSFKGDAAHDNTPDVKAWSAALKKTGRPMQFVLSWSLSHNQIDTWKANSNGWRIDTDVECYCDTLVTWNNSVKGRWNDVVQYIPDAGPGHWNNLDSLDVGSGKMDGITEAERQSYMTLWAIEAAPLYLGDDLTQLDDYGTKLLTNDEVIAVDQAGVPAKPVSQQSDQQVWYARNADGSYTVALFNLGSAPTSVTANFGDFGLTGAAKAHDLWSHQELGLSNGSFTATLPVHGSKLLRLTPVNPVQVSAPAVVHGTASTPTSVSLAWDASAGKLAPVTGYDVFAGGHKVASATGTSTTFNGLKPSTSYTFTVVAHDRLGRSSAASTAVSYVTPAASGPVVYEAENGSPGGGATVYDCACSGGKKVGYIGGSGLLTMNNIKVAAEGTYLVKLGYVDGDTSRSAVVTVNGSSFRLPAPGTNDNDWNTARTITVPIYLMAGNNQVIFGNPSDSVFDVDQLTV
ncbi:fibronectin type III domain-containing protein [Amycolatopsis sp. NPDC051372]|uniref:fibronectin type III domain-containing protein n=1 Tax=Amycolatopsis sp. NPDC051372 TaxID=3155669 RepID=UPI0034444481